ncbi:DUF1788 domain-containing protein [Flavobacterium lindanitolerans]|uniref:DUF1788 domain-containing protein n=1 Tax=Flavobacterium lindanitolerans TaxID=428988 RepID=UPI0031DDFA5F
MRSGHDKLIENFKTIFEVTASKEFLNMEGLNGEVPFWIAPYDIQLQDQADTEINHLTKKLNNNGVTVLVLDLFEISVRLLEDNIGLDKMFMVEKKKTKDKFKKALQSTLNLHERFIPFISNTVKKEEPQILILTGVGSVYPFIRSHNVLNNLQSAITAIPTLMFFPGEYNGKALNLFGDLKDDNYYRAFNIFEYKINITKR